MAATSGQGGIWEVVGGSDKGGILVRQGLELNSAAEPERLATGSLIRQLHLEGERLQYEKLSGTGPVRGWVSLSIKDKKLVERSDKRPPVQIWEGPAKDAPLQVGETLTKDCAGFALRAEDDPLRGWIPLRQVLPEGVCRQVICFGPPSARAQDWAASDAFGTWKNSAETGNALAQLARCHKDELLLVECSLAVDRADWASDLAKMLITRLDPSWAAVAVSVGAWLLVEFMNALSQLGDAGKTAVSRCETLHIVGFPHPEAGLSFPRPKGVADVDWKYAESVGAPMQFMVPNNSALYYFCGDGAISQERIRGWFQFQPSLQDGSTKGAYPIFGLQGDHGVLQQAWRRTELFWALGNHMWASNAPAGFNDLLQYQVAAELMGHGKRTVSLFDESEDEVLAALNKEPTMVPIPNVNMNEGQWFVNENWTSGNAAAEIGLDIRMYADKASAPTSGSKIGCRIVCAVRFGLNPGIKVQPGGAVGVHGGAIQSVMDEITAQCVRYWAVPGCTTRKINHTINGRVAQFQTYKCECDIEKIQDGCVYVSRGKLIDPSGRTVCTSRADMLDFAAMVSLQQAAPQ